MSTFLRVPGEPSSAHDQDRPPTPARFSPRVSEHSFIWPAFPGPLPRLRIATPPPPRARVPPGLQPPGAPASPTPRLLPACVGTCVFVCLRVVSGSPSWSTTLALGSAFCPPAHRLPVRPARGVPATPTPCVYIKLFPQWLRGGCSVGRLQVFALPWFLPATSCLSPFPSLPPSVRPSPFSLSHLEFVSP